MSKKNFKGKKPDNARYRGTQDEKAYDKGERNAANEAEERERFDRRSRKGRNDPMWYAQNPQLLKDAASLAFGTPVGTRLDLDPGERIGFDSITESNIRNYALPGIMRLTMAQTIGVSTDNTSAANIAARNLYAFVRFANSGRANYESPDLMMYVMGMSSIYAYYAYLVRAYGVLRTYTQYNRYLPQGLVQAMGINFSDLQQNMADFRYYINQFAVKIGAFAVPGNLSYFLRCVWLYSNVYSDAQGMKTQYYVTKPAGFYRFHEVKEGPGELEWFNVGDNMTFETLVNVGNMMLERIQVSEDFNIMSGDILKAFGSNLFKVSTIPEDFVIVPVYNEMVLTQIHNTTVLEGVTIPNITQDVTLSANGGAILSQPTFNPSIDYGVARLLDIRMDTPTPEVVMEATRNMVTGSPIDPTNLLDGFKVNSCGADICVGASVYYFYANPSSEETWDIVTSADVKLAYFTNFEAPINSPTIAGLASSMQYLNKVEHFDWHPYFNVNVYPAGQTGNLAGSWAGFIGDTDNAIVVVEKDLRKMHDTAMLSMFAVPAMGALGTK